MRSAITSLARARRVLLGLGHRGAHQREQAEALDQRDDDGHRDRDRTARPVLHAPSEPAAPMVDGAELALARRQHDDALAQRLVASVLRPRLLPPPVRADPLVPRVLRLLVVLCVLHLMEHRESATVKRAERGLTWSDWDAV